MEVQQQLTATPLLIFIRLFNKNGSYHCILTETGNSTWYVEQSFPKT